MSASNQSIKTPFEDRMRAVLQEEKDNRLAMKNRRSELANRLGELVDQGGRGGADYIEVMNEMIDIDKAM